MKTFDVEVTLTVVVTVEAGSQKEAKEEAIQLAESGYFENGVEASSARIMK